MIIQSQPNKATCLITSFAMALDVPVAQLIKLVGHDGLEVLPEKVYRGHSIWEMQWICYQYHRTCYEFAGKETHCVGRSYGTCVATPYTLEDLMPRHRGVLVFYNHATAWDGTRVFDPNGTIYQASKTPIDMFYAII